MNLAESIKEDYSLKNLNTFGVDAMARYFISAGTTAQVYRLFTECDLVRKERLLILGGGSNLLFTRDFDGLVVKMDLMGTEILSDSGGMVEIKAFAGQNWDALVSYCVGMGLGGLENLSLIPGTAGAAPVQNIGAYGAEISDVLVSVDCWDRKSMQMVTLSAAECHPGYRTSIFKTSAKDRYVILSVTLRLTRNPVFNVSYGALEEEMKRTGTGEISLESIRNAVISVRRKKLPDPSRLGNAGSFFKNPEVTGNVYHELVKTFPGIVGYPQAGGSYKLAAGWMIEHCGWKGYRKGDAGVHHEQALVLVNYGNATGVEILDLAIEISQSVMKRFGIELEKEVNIL